MAELRSEGRLQRLLEERVIERFLKCGDPHHGFARIYCPYAVTITSSRFRARLGISAELPPEARARLWGLG
jgi:hypothetical protein